MTSAITAVTEVFSVLMGAPDSWMPVGYHDKVMTKRFPDYRGGSQWTMIVNANGEPRAVEEAGFKVDVPPITAAVFWNGWLAGFVDPWGGVIAAHPDGANEDTFLRSLKAAIEKETDNG